jgi:hypothetical protein
MTRRYGKGDHYYIPAGVLHSAQFHCKTYVIDILIGKELV